MQVISQKDEELRSVAPVRHAPPSRPPRAHRLKSRARQNRAQPSGGIGRGTCTGADRARTAGGARDGALSIAHDPIRVERGHRCEDTHPRRRRRRTPSWRAQHAPHQIRRSPSPSARLSAMKLSGQVFSCVTARTAVHLAGHFGLILDGRVETAVTSRTRRPSATRVANKNKGSRSCTARSAPPRRRPAS